MIRLADVNVVLALLLETHARHERAWRWWESRPDETVGHCLLVRLGVLRLLTNAVVMEGEPFETSEAWEAWRQFDADPRTVELPAPKQAHELLFRRYVENRPVTPNLWTDAWLAALAESTGNGLTTFEAGFRRFNLADLELLR